MLTDYSKQSQDIAGHSAFLLDQNDSLLARQRRIAAAMAGGQPRASCIVCDRALAGLPAFDHRGVAYCRCSACGHVQSAREAPAGYPYADQDFANIYPALDPAAFEARRRRIYDPKRDWALRAAQATRLGDLTTRRWCELGSGAGYFLASLREAGTTATLGLEAEAQLVAQARDHLGAGFTEVFSGSLAEAVRAHDADVYVAWFVIEHCFETGALLDALREKPAGTAFLFSVPTFGLATMLEGAGAGHFARNLDGVLHLQLFTDQSIRAAMARAGYEIRAEWLFGQDAHDLYRALSSSPSGNAEELERLLSAVDDLQAAIDRARLSDARHILAVRT